MFLIMSSIFFVVTIIVDLPIADIPSPKFIMPLISALLFVAMGYAGLKAWAERKRWQFILFNVLLFLNAFFRLAATVYFVIHFNVFRIVGSVIPFLVMVNVPPHPIDSLYIYESVSVQWVRPNG